MADRSGQPQSQLYLMRLWIAPGLVGAAGWRGKLQPVPGDASYCFAGGSELLALLATLLAIPDSLPGAAIAGTDGGQVPAAPGPSSPQVT